MKALILALALISFNAYAYDDTDGDGIWDGEDNCVLVANPDQKELPRELTGVACEFNPADFNQDGVVSFPDFGILRSAWGSANSSEIDLNNDGIVNFPDFNMLRMTFFSTESGPGCRAQEFDISEHRWYQVTCWGAVELLPWFSDPQCQLDSDRWLNRILTCRIDQPAGEA